MMAADTIAPDRFAPPVGTAMLGVIPYLFIPHARAGEASAFYARAFGARETGRIPDSDDPARLMHCQVEINGGTLMMSDFSMQHGPDHEPVRSTTMLIVVKDGDAWWQRAVAAGCTVTVPFERMFWGDRYGQMVDPFGVRWAINELAEAQA